MKLNTIHLLILAVALILSVGVATAQQEMTKDQWQQEMTKYTQMRNDLMGKVKTLDASITAANAQSVTLDGDYEKCLDGLYALVGSTRDQAASYRDEIASAEEKAAELMRLSDADLLARSDDVKALEAKVAELWGNKLSLVPEFWDRLKELDNKVKSLKDTMGKQVKTYTVGTWSKDRDCLWNISKKPDIYDNAWLWPRIWQGNRDQIKDPDVIEKGQILKIPQGKEMSSDETSAAKKYYAKVARKAASAQQTQATTKPAEPAKK